MKTPTDIEPLFRQALSFHQRGAVARAKSIYEQILATNPVHFDTCHLLGVACMQTGSPERGADLISKALTIKPDSADAHCNLAHVLRALGRHDEALASIERAISLRPDFAQYRAERGTLLQAQGKYSEAIACFEEALRLDPRSAEACQYKATALGKLNRLEEALASCNASLELAPRSAGSLSLKGTLLRKLGRLEEALASLDIAIGLNPSMVEAYRQRGKILRSLNRLEEAAENYEKAVQLDPHHAETFLNLAVVLAELNREDETLARCDRAVALKPELVAAHTQRAYALGTLGRMAEALESFERAMSLTKSGDAARLGRAWLHARCERWDEAKQDLEDVLKRDPANVMAWRGLAMLPASHLTAERTQDMLDCPYVPRLGEGLAAQLFTKARLLRHLQRYDESFERLREANDVRLSEIPQTNEWLGSFDGTLQNANSWTPRHGLQEIGDTKALLVILGPSRSGKSALEELLCSSTVIKRGFEGRAARDANRKLGEILIDRNAVQQSADVQRKVIEALVALSPEDVLAGEHEAITVTNPFLLSLVHMIFDLHPRSCFVFVQRDPVDNAAEIYASDYTDRYDFAYTPREALDYVRLYTRASSVLAQKMQGRALTVAYEDLLQSPGSVISSVYKMLGLDPPRGSPPPAEARSPRSVYRAHFAALCAEQGIAL